MALPEIKKEMLKCSCARTKTVTSAIYVIFTIFSEVIFVESLDFFTITKFTDSLFSKTKKLHVSVAHELPKYSHKHI
jgi:hypothetical protein